MKKLFTLCLLASFCSGMHAQDVGLKLDQGRIVGLRDTINLCLRNGFYYRVLLPNGDTTDIATINDLNNLNTTINASLGTLTPRFDSIKVAASNPSVGNIYVSSVDSRIHFKNGNYWYRLGVQDSTAIINPLLANIAAYYKLDESTGNALDATGNGFAASVSSGVTRPVTGEIGTAYQFNGSSGILQTSANIDTASMFTYAMWIKTTATGGALITTNSGNSPYFGLNSGGMLELDTRGVATLGTSTGAVNSGAWTHVAVTYDYAGNYKFYINGTISGSGNYPATFQWGSQYLIGSLSGAGYFAGYMDEIAFYKNRVLTQSEIALLMTKTYPFN